MYRIIQQKNGLNEVIYYTQKKGWFFWHDIKGDYERTLIGEIVRETKTFYSRKEAEEFILKLLNEQKESLITNKVVKEISAKQ